MSQKYASALLEYIRKSTSPFHAVKELCRRLADAGYQQLEETSAWQLQPEGKYYVKRSDSSLIAFSLPEGEADAFRLSAAHSDSPAFRIKENPMEKAAGGVWRLNTEKYGGMIMSSWMDRPLSVAGRAYVKTEDGIRCHLVDLDRDLLVIPSLAIHMNRQVNDGVKIDPKCDTLPLYSLQPDGDLLALVAAVCGVKKEAILSHELNLYCREQGCLVGEKEEFLLSPRLDDLACVFGCFEGFLQAKAEKCIPVLCVFDHEEVGSSTLQGAGSSFLRDTLYRISLALGKGEEAHRQALAASFLVSADNAHAIHPNHPEYSDRENAPVLGGGVVIKYNANRRYATDGLAAALFKEICRLSGAKVQTFANRSDLPGGSTLGSIASTFVPVTTVDIGLPQLAMHSACETAAASDVEDLVGIMKTYYEAQLTREGENFVIR